MERPGSVDPDGEEVAERTWDCPCHAWHLGSLRRSMVSGAEVSTISISSICEWAHGVPEICQKPRYA
jgi:hypothetical protein